MPKGIKPRGFTPQPDEAETKECIGRADLASPSTEPDTMIQVETVFAGWATLQKITANVSILPQPYQDLNLHKLRAGIMNSEYEPPDMASFTVSEMPKEACTLALALLVEFPGRIAVRPVLLRQEDLVPSGLRRQYIASPCNTRHGNGSTPCLLLPGT